MQWESPTDISGLKGISASAAQCHVQVLSVSGICMGDFLVLNPLNPVDIS